MNATTSVPLGGAAGVSTPDFDGQPGVSPLHVQWTYRVRPARLDHLRAVAEETSIEAVKGEWLRRTNPDWEADDAFYFMHMRMLPATEEYPPGIYQTLFELDRVAVLAEVERAAANADWVVLSVHAHQAKGGDRNTAETPPFLREFARDAVDAGADAVVGTGPHALRGIELYDGALICYSLGNLCFQDETIYRVPDVRSEDAGTAVPDVRGGDETSSDGQRTDAVGATVDHAGEDSDADLDHNADNWRSVIPECTFAADGTLEAVTLYPCTLQPRADPPRRGTPVRASGDEARSILETVASRSTPFGTTVTVDGDVGRLVL